MTLGIKDNKTGKIITCNTLFASDLMIIDPNDLYRMINKARADNKTVFDYRHFSVSIEAEHVPPKKRGKSIDQIINRY